MRHRLRLLLLVALCPAAAAAQPDALGSPPLAVDLRKVAVGSWAEYSAVSGRMTMRTRWALVGRDEEGHTMEMSMEGGPMPLKVTMRMVLARDPTASPRPVKRMVLQIGDQAPMEIPVDAPNVPAQTFRRPDAKKLVARETITVAAGSFRTRHYRDNVTSGTVDIWTAEGVAPLGLVKLKTTPPPNAKGPGGMPAPSVTMELAARGADAKPAITNPARPFDPALLGGGGGQPDAR